MCFFILGMLGVCLNSSAQTERKFLPSGRLVFSGQTKNFGSVTRGEVLRHRFVFKNQGRGPLKIHGVHTSCGCVISQVVGDRDLQPGKEGFLEVSFDTRAFVGRVRKTVTVVAHHDRRPKVLSLRADVRPEFLANPPVITVRPSGSEMLTGDTGRSRLHGVGRFELHVGSLEYDPKLLRADLIKGKKGYELLVQLQPGVKEVHTEVLFPTNSKVLPKGKVLVRTKPEKNLGHFPEFLDFGVIEPGEPQKAKLQLEDPIELTGYEVKIELQGSSLQESKKFLSVEAAKSAKDSDGQYDIAIRHPAASGSWKGELLLMEKNGTGTPLRIPMYGFFL